MTNPILDAAVAKATVLVPENLAMPARFVLYPNPGANADALAAAVVLSLAAFDAEAAVNSAAGTEVVVTLPGRMMRPGGQAYDAAYLMINEWALYSAEPELYTDYFPDEDGATGKPGMENAYD